MIWALAVVVLLDLAMPFSPGSFVFESGESVDVARRMPVQAASATLVPVPLQPRLPVSVQQTPMVPASVQHREATAPRTFAIPLARAPQYEVAALNAADPA